MTRLYAIEEDLVPVFRFLEQRSPLKYTTAGRFAGRDEVRSFGRGDLIPNLGVARGHSTVLCASFLVTEPHKEVFIREQFGAAFVDQLTTDDAIVLNVGGLWEGTAAIEGSVGSRAVSSPKTHELLRRFRYALRKLFVNVRSCYVGPKALAMFRAGGRLTPDTRSPPEYDLIE